MLSPEQNQTYINHEVRAEHQCVKKCASRSGQKIADTGQYKHTNECLCDLVTLKETHDQTP